MMIFGNASYSPFKVHTPIWQATTECSMGSYLLMCVVCLRLRWAIHQAINTAMVAAKITNVARALICGLIPMRTLENTCIGKVVDPGPDTKLAITKSSKDRVKASNQPDIKAGAIIGKVTKKNTFQGGAPKSCAASSIDSSSSCRREDTTTATKAVQKVTWAIQMVNMPRSPGQPKDCPIATNNNSSDKPVITSGITKGAVIMLEKAVLPLNVPIRTITMEAMVPNTTDVEAANKAIFKLIQAAPSICGSRNSSPYHLKEKPAQTVTNSDLLNENITKIKIGA